MIRPRATSPWRSAKARRQERTRCWWSSRLNDAILLTRELVKQRWSPMAVLSMGPGWYEDQYLQDAGQAVRRADELRALVRSQQETEPRCSRPRSPRRTRASTSTPTTSITFEALLVAADAYKRAGSTDPKALADAIRKTNITDNVSAGPGHSFDEKGQNVQLKNSAIQNRDGKLVTVAPKAAANAKPEWPMTPYDKRG